MPEYDIHALCSDCGNFHDLLVRVTMAERFEACSVRDAYTRELISPAVLTGVDRLKCTVTGMEIRLPPPHMLVLVLVKNER